MKKSLYTLLIFMVLLLGACDRDSSVVETTPESSDIFAFVPTDTPYLIAGLEGLPDELVEMYLESSKPFLSDLEKMLDTMGKKDDSADTESAEPDFNLHAFLVSLLGQYENNYSIEGLKNLGLDPNAKSVAYGLGPFPVVRMTILDGDKVRANISKAFADAGGEIPTEKELNGRKYWQFGDERITMIGSIGEADVSFGVTPTSMLDEALLNILGQAKPANPMNVSAEITKFNRNYGYDNYSTGWFKPEKFLALFLSDNSSAASSLRDLIEFDNTTVTAVCEAEITAMVATVPLIHFGTKKYDTSEIVYSGAIELEAGLASELQQLTVDNTLSSSNSGSLLNFGFAMNLAKLREWLLSTAKARTETPYQCSELAGLNAMYSAAYANLNQPLPPFLGNLFGFRVSIDDMDLGQLITGGSAPKTGKMLLSILTSKPEMLVGMGQMFLPDLAGIDMSKGADPVALKLAMIPTGDEPTWAAMSDSALGVAVGEGMDSKLQPFLNSGKSKNGEFLTFGMDSKMYSKLLESIEEIVPENTDIATNNASLKAMMNMYESMFFKASLNDKGFVFESQTKLK